MVVGILCFPAGWDNEDVRGICGKEAQDYGLGLCGIRWAFVMAFICVIDAFILSLLALVLSKRQIEPLPALNSSNNIYRGKKKYFWVFALKFIFLDIFFVFSAFLASKIVILLFVFKVKSTEVSYQILIHSTVQENLWPTCHRWWWYLTSKCHLMLHLHNHLPHLEVLYLHLNSTLMDKVFHHLMEVIPNLKCKTSNCR